MSVGFVNGSQVNYTSVNGVNGERLNFAALFANQADQQPNASASNAVLASSATVQQSQTFLSAASAAIASASAFTQATQTLVAQAVAAVGSTFTQSQAVQGFSGTTVAAVAALLNELEQDDDLFAQGELDAIKAVLVAIQQAQTLMATATATVGASLNQQEALDVGQAAGVSAIAAATTAQELDDLLDSIFKQLLIRKALGSGIDRHAQGSAITPRAGGNRVTVH
ncbi:hypothetical protein [Limnobacter sp. P1]|uniref:hypothetical protein n=1 Tax=Limnobacter olei TaxID=3031298 RepID=UPI0023AE6DA2|nr:hypothetical protein [Limnobacter sp. P1]